MIRYFLKSDFDSIYKLGNEISSTFSKTIDLEQIYDDKNTKILVYVKNEKVVGFLMYIELKDTIDILNLIVEKKLRNQKIASCLIDYMISEMAPTIKLITLEVRESNTPAIHLYKKFNFQIVHTRVNYYSDGENGLLMGRVIE